MIQIIIQSQIKARLPIHRLVSKDMLIPKIQFGQVETEVIYYHI